MANGQILPFSARNRSERSWIDADFPNTAREALLHILYSAIDGDYLEGWSSVAKELRRIARASPKRYLTENEARHDAENILRTELKWPQVFDFCERLYSYLARERAADFFSQTNPITKLQSQKFLSDEIRRLFEEESFGWDFQDGLVQRRGKNHTITLISKAGTTLADNTLQAARIHFSKALRHFRDREKPDYENAVKEAVCAVEAAAKQLFPEAKATTLGDFIKWATSNKDGIMPQTIGHTFSGLYAFRNSGQGVSHGGATGGPVTPEVSEYVLAIAASQIVLLAGMSTSLDEPPF